MGARSSKSMQPLPASSLPPATSLPRSKGPSSASSSSPWMDLQPDLAELLLLRLTSHADRVRFAAVCRHWRYVAREYSLPRLPPPLPWISFRGGSFETFTLKDGDVSERHFIGIGEEAVCLGCFGNWQLFQVQAGSGRWRSRRHHYLRNPLSGATVQLPGYCDKPVRLNASSCHGKPSIWRCSEFDISKVIVCSDDLIAAIVLYPHRTKNRQVVVCCRPGMSSSWSRGFYNRNHQFIDMTFYQGKLYTVTQDGRLFVHEVEESDRSAQAKPWVNQIQQVDLAPWFSDMSCYLLISITGKLLMVRWVAYHYGNNRELVVKVFEADLETSQWLEVKKLNGQVLFVSRNCSKAISTSGHAGYPKGNRIYFLDSNLIGSCLPNTNNCTCLYYMRSKRLVPISVDQDSRYARKAAWFFP